VVVVAYDTTGVVVVAVFFSMNKKNIFMSYERGRKIEKRKKN
jgi:hypothetical protein